MIKVDDYYRVFLSRNFRDRRLLLHSSFSRLRAGSGLTPVEFLDQVFRSEIRGLLLPALKWKFLPDSGKCVLTEAAWKAVDTGIVPWTAVNKYCLQRTVHPTHSIAVSGDFGSWNPSDHINSQSQCGAGSPWLEIAKDDKVDVVFLNVGIEAATICHVAEETMFPSIYLADPEIEVDFINEGSSYSIRLKRHRRVTRFYSKLIPALGGRWRCICDRFGNRFSVVPARTLFETACYCLLKERRFFLESF